MAVMAAVLNTMLLVLKTSYLMWFIGNVFCIPFLEFIMCWRILSYKRLFRMMIETQTIRILVNGIGEGLNQLLGGRIHFAIWYGLAIGTADIVETLLQHERYRNSYISKVSLIHKEKKIQVVAMHDSGNSLVDGNGRPVSFIRTEHIETLHLEPFGTVFYETVGDHSGSSSIYELERAIIGKQIIDHIIVADGGTALKKGNVEMILNQAYCRKEE